ncbi:unnamed protein product, partial [Iphiclides podalirius]
MGTRAASLPTSGRNLPHNEMLSMADDFRCPLRRPPAESRTASSARRAGSLASGSAAERLASRGLAAVDRLDAAKAYFPTPYMRSSKCC